MRGIVYYDSVYCGMLEEVQPNHYTFTYEETYYGPPVSLTMPLSQKQYTFSHFPAFFDGLLPEGVQLEALLRTYKLDAHDYMKQLLIVGTDLVGAVTVLPAASQENQQ